MIVIPFECPHPVDSSSVTPATWFSQICEGEALGIEIPVECPRPVDCNIVVHDTFSLERLRDFNFSVPPPGGIWLIMTILIQYLSSNLVPPPHRNSSQVPPRDRK